ncbi:MAG: DUF2442 domain-containing protein [Pelobium sp.]
MIATHQIENINFINDSLQIVVDGKNYEFELKEISQKLLEATTIERNFFKISPSGYGIHWPLVDEDLAVDGLIK